MSTAESVYTVTIKTPGAKSKEFAGSIIDQNWLISPTDQAILMVDGKSIGTSHNNEYEQLDKKIFEAGMGAGRAIATGLAGSVGGAAFDVARKYAIASGAYQSTKSNFLRRYYVGTEEKPEFTFTVRVINPDIDTLHSGFMKIVSLPNATETLLSTEEREDAQLGVLRNKTKLEQMKAAATTIERIMSFDTRNGRSSSTNNQTVATTSGFIGSASAITSSRPSTPAKWRAIKVNTANYENKVSVSFISSEYATQVLDIYPSDSSERFASRLSSMSFMPEDEGAFNDKLNDAGEAIKQYFEALRGIGEEFSDESLFQNNAKDIAISNLTDAAKLFNKLNTGSLTRLVDIRLGEFFLLKKFLIRNFNFNYSKVMDGKNPSYVDIDITAVPYMIPLENSVTINEFGQIVYDGYGAFNRE